MYFSFRAQVLSFCADDHESDQGLTVGAGGCSRFDVLHKATYFSTGLQAVLRLLTVPLASHLKKLR